MKTAVMLSSKQFNKYYWNYARWNIVQAHGKNTWKNTPKVSTLMVHLVA